MTSENGLNRPTVLVVDDNDTTRAVLRGILRSVGLEVVGEAKDGASGLAKIRELNPMLVCLDVLMPDMSGIEVLQQIREWSSDVRVLMVTGSSDRETVQAAVSGGANGYLIKPFNVQKVIVAVENALGCKIDRGA